MPTSSNIKKFLTTLIENNAMKRLITLIFSAVLLCLMLSGCSGGESSSSSTSSTVTAVNQGAAWNPENQAAFYYSDQGSWIMPYEWAKALKLPNGQSFLSQLTSSYGYIPNPVSPSNPEGLPVGFLVANPGTKNQQLSMNCAACHTRQIEVAGNKYRIDGGPAFSNLYALFQGIDLIVGNTLSDQAAFDAFQAAVQVPAETLREQLNTWYTPYNTLMTRSLPTEHWGIGRADAVAMLQNRVSGLDIGPIENQNIIASNIAVAAQPVRYPFIWNSGKQDFTQWAGTSINGDATYAFSRNTGEALGVFALFKPRRDPAVVGGVNFLIENSVKYETVNNIQTLVDQIGPPKWPWPVDNAMVLKGKGLYEINCTSCHGIKQGQPRPGNPYTWATPVQNVNTDSSYYKNFAVGKGTSDSGILTGLTIPFSNPISTVPASGAAIVSLFDVANSSALVQLNPLINLSIKAPERTEGSFESKVLQGVWSSAPYLHNGSVPTLAALLTPSASRPTSFQVGPVYDTTNVGLATDQPGGSATVRVTTDCATMNGNSNCGHEGPGFGTDLTPDEKKALIEYLKTL
jgi:mono/diheme cytochrome c family protein